MTQISAIDLDMELENLQLHCRTCLNVLDCFGSSYDIGLIPNSLSKLLQLYPESKNDLYPKCICEVCFQQFQSFQEFENTTRKATQILKECIESKTTQLLNLWINQEEESVDEKPEIQSFQPENLENDTDMKKEKTDLPQNIITKEEAIENTSLLDLNKTNESKSVYESTEKKTLQCDQCQHSFDEKDQLENHIKKTHPDRIICKYVCGRTFKFQKTATNHYSDKHKTFICEDCGQIFLGAFKMRIHRYVHRPIEDRPYQCEICDKRFIIKRNYTEHLIRHEGTKKFECPECGLKTFRKNELALHMKFHNRENEFPCDICQKIFTKRFNLQKHKDVVHYGIRKFSCKFCDQLFGEAATLKFHERIHTGEKPHKCHICERSFRQPKLLSIHLKKHV